jgi:hypothetical protein
MYWLDVAKIALPAAICAFVLGPRTATAFLLAIVTLVVFGLGFLGPTGGGGTGLGPAIQQVAKDGPPMFLHIMGAGAAGIVVGWWMRTWMTMVRSSRMTPEPRSTI